MEDLGNKLTVKTETGSSVIIDVLDIIDSDEFDKTFMIYTVGGDKDNIFASILNENHASFSLDTIQNPSEIDFINGEIDRYVSEGTLGETI